MLDVLFITPTATTNPLKESLGPVLLSTILRREGIGTEILSFARIGDPTDYAAFFEKAVAMILEKKPRILSMYTRCDCYHIMLRLAERAKADLGCIVVFAGPQADITAVETLEEIPWVDYICRGEGETTVYPFFSSLLRGEPDLSVDGVVYRSAGEIKVNPRPELIRDLDTLPIPDYSVVSHEIVVDPKACFSIDVGRGCPFGCTYCSTKTFWGRKYRLKSPKRILEELQHFHDMYGISYFAFEHDMFTMNRAQVIEICRLIRELPYKVYWNCSARSDCIDEELIRIMADSGLRWIYLGIETGSPRMQKLVNKNLKLETVLPLVKYITSCGVRVVTSFIYGFPEETEEDMSQTLSLMTDLLSMKNVQVQNHLCAFLPGTALGEAYRDRLVPALVQSDQAGDVGYDENADLMESHPRLFLQCREYPTELRAKLAYFPYFMRVFQALKPAYLYYARQYPREKLLQMYLDFVEDNGNILLSEDPMSDHERLFRLIANDAFPKRFASLPWGAIAADVCRLEGARFTVGNGKVPSATEILSFNPNDLQNCDRIEDCPAKWSMVTIIRDKDGRIQTLVRSM